MCAFSYTSLSPESSGVYQTVHDPGYDCWQEREGGSANVRAPSAADVKVVSSAQSGLSSVCRTEEQGAPSAVSSRDLTNTVAGERAQKG